MNFHGGYFGSKGMMDFSVNIPPLSYPEGLKELMFSTFDELRNYPEIDGISARDAIARKTGYDSEKIILGNGATELIYLYSRSIGVSKALILEPTFTEYRRALELNQVEVHSFSLLDFVKSDESLLSIDVHHSALLTQIIERILTQKIELLVLCNPNNPTGHLYSSDFIQKIIEGVNNPDFKIFIDESFLDFVSSDKLRACNLEASDLKNVFLLRSMTKNFEVPGLRIGYGLSDFETIKKMGRYKEPWSLNAFALKAIPFLVDQEDHIKRIKKWCQEESDFISEALSRVEGLFYYKGEANYFLIKIPELMHLTFFDKMLARKIYLRKCEDFMGLGKPYYRIAIRERDENRLMVDAIQEVFSEYKI
ncbi:pyridoxal phosphate-dependent aminotransferase [Fusibacter ferrireducens]|uniref:Aminotransferase class I/II-fold pyridoxal phosphate-dependent enzyme n=1 Tax=Fusibacter ferrireducens TaxID=2785058 RepID=A0ABR9ZWP3_9FIRM|nr:histidinol-phosphate transaminase [Fusibacter ferrireducens]MBF4694776.1 aminotransferase class I/II-fold pyridoxal phosphate-dependent enzyme [Fusibacter ferrireducens]